MSYNHGPCIAIKAIPAQTGRTARARSGDLAISRAGAQRGSGRIVLTGACSRPPSGRRVSAIAAVFTLLLTGAAAAQEPPPVASARIPPPGPYLPGFDALTYDISLTLPETGQRISGSARIAIAVLEPRRDTLRLDLSGLLVTAVRGSSPGVGAALPFRQDDGRLFVTVPPGVRAGDTLRIEIEYEGTPDDGLIIGQNVHGVRTIFADDYPDRARFWFPAVDHPGDKAVVSWAVRAPSGWQVIANGRRVATQVAEAVPADGVWRYETRVPIPTYTMVIGATDFAIDEIASCAAGGITELRPDGCVRVTSWAFPQDRENARRIFRRAGDMIEYYASRFGPFPYEKLAHVQSATRYGGMENVGAIFYSERAIQSGRLGETTVAHETIHQWFGDAVTPANWHHVWLSEGFATYFGMQYFEHADGADAFRSLLASSAQSYLASDVTDLPIVDSLRIPGAGDLTAVLSANSYQKGGQVLHMLRGLLGDDAFFAGLRDYFAQYVHGNARTIDLQNVLERTGGQDLDWFFEQWVYRPGFPHFRVTHSHDANAGEVVVTVEQVQKAEWPAFRMPVEFEIVTADRTWREKAEVSGRRTVLRFASPVAAQRVIIDPDGWLLKRVE
jgi:aminopeptidase N